MLSLVDGIGRYGQNSADVLARLRFFRPARSQTAVPAHPSRNQMFCPRYRFKHRHHYKDRVRCRIQQNYGDESRGYTQA